MRWLIDGYNLMYAAGWLGKRFGPEGFRRARQRFLNELAAVLDPVEAHQTTIVFDASSPPPERPEESSHKGMAVLFAVHDENADARIESLIAHHSAPKTLTVVSSDHRVRTAATRRKARALTSDDFLMELDSRKRRTHRRAVPEPFDPERVRREGPGQQESAYWLEQFQDLDEEPALQELKERESLLLTDEEIAQIEREVEQEFRF